MKKLSLIVFLLGAAVLLSIAVLGSTKQSKPNIIFMMADDLGIGDLGCYGQDKIQTPNIDKLAAEGMSFTRFYAGSTVCAPSRCSLLTGKHTGNAHVRRNYAIGHWDSFLGQLPIPEDEQTFFEVVKQNNYLTSCYGKWSIGRAESSGAPDRHAVDDFFGYNCQRHAHSYYPYYLEANRGEKVWQEGNSRMAGGKNYSHDVIMERAYDFIKENKDTNFFMYLPFTIPHGPLEVPELGIYENKDWEENAKILAAMITRMDTDVGKVVDLLKELGIDENTIIFYTSDNGTHKVYKDFFNSATAFRGEKTTMYEGGLRVPFIARWPGRIEAGSTSDNISAFWDVMPTIADLTGTKAPLEIDGISFAPTLFGQEQKQHHHLYWEYYGHKGAIALRKGKWKLVRNDLHKNYYTAPVELYNLEEDIAESTNVASEHPEVVEDLLGLVKASHSPNALHKFRSQ